MAEPEQIGAAVFIVQSGMKVTAVIQEFKELVGTTTLSKIPTLCIIYDGKQSDFHGQLVRELTTAFPSMKQEQIISTNAPMPVQGSLTIKQILDSRKISDFVVFSSEENLSALLVVVDMIFTSAYHMKVKVYSSLYVDVPAILANTGEDTKSAFEKDCSEYLARLTINPHEELEIISSDLIGSKTFVHGFSTRKGGCSFYPSVASLNLAFTPEKRDPFIVVEENRHRLLKSVGAPSHRFEMAKAVHGNTVWTVGTPQLPGYDAIVCDKPGVVVAAPAADCVTIVLADDKRSVCAAVHSGWKGYLICLGWEKCYVLFNNTIYIPPPPPPPPPLCYGKMIGKRDFLAHPFLLKFFILNCWEGTYDSTSITLLVCFEMHREGWEKCHAFCSIQ